MRWIMEIEIDDDKALDQMLRYAISNQKVSDIRVDGLSDDELKARIHAVADANLKQPLG
jgi:hypothetical protein